MSGNFASKTLPMPLTADKFATAVKSKVFLSKYYTCPLGTLCSSPSVYFKTCLPRSFLSGLVNQFSQWVNTVEVSFDIHVLLLNISPVFSAHSFYEK